MYSAQLLQISTVKQEIDLQILAHGCAGLKQVAFYHLLNSGVSEQWQ